MNILQAEGVLKRSGVERDVRWSAWPCLLHEVRSAISDLGAMAPVYGVVVFLENHDLTGTVQSLAEEYVGGLA